MSDGSKIEWTDASWPVVTGCTHISAGCDFCYAARLTSGRLRHLPEYAGLAEHGKFNGAVRLLPERLDWPLRWRKPRLIFVSDMADLFHDAVPDDYIARVFAVMAIARRHTFQVLTKRHGRMRSLLSDGSRWPGLLREGLGWLVDHAHAPLPAGDFDAAVSWMEGPELAGQNVPPLPNVWLGVSVEDQKWADIRIPALMDTPAAVRFISAEPLLGPVDLGAWLGQMWKCRECGDIQGQHTGSAHCFRCRARNWPLPVLCLDWVIAGGESGPGSRACDLEWLRSLRSQCSYEYVPLFVKQLGSILGRELGAGSKGGDWDNWPEDLRVRQFPVAARTAA